jgi:hypothetical protein
MLGGYQKKDCFLIRKLCLKVFPEQATNVYQKKGLFPDQEAVLKSVS